MSTSIFQSPFTIQADDTYILKTGQPDANRIARRVISLTAVSAYDGAITLKSRPRGSSAAFTTQPYEKQFLNGVAADGSKVTTGISGTVGDSLIELDDSGLELALVSSGRTVGSMTVNTRSLNEV